MGIQTIEVKIGDSNYAITQMPARRALKMQARLLKLIGPAASQLLVTKDGQEDELLPLAVSLLVEKLDDKNFDQLVMDLIEGVRADGMELTAPIVDIHFAGKLNELFLLMKSVLEVNFADFFQDGGIIKTLLDQSAIEKEVPSALRNG